MSFSQLFQVLVVSIAAVASLSTQAATDTHYVTLADARMATTHEGRQQLKYLASCALNENMVLTAEHQGERLEFPGGLGLAPQWFERAMTEQEQRWISACMLARTNFFGTKVMLSMRSDFPSQAPGLQTWREEDAAYTLEEATFFGNLFTDRPVAYVCGPEQTPERRANLTAQRRVCALPDAQGITACRMIYVGACSAQNYRQNGQAYEEAISIFLPPQATPATP